MKLSKNIGTTLVAAMMIFGLVACEKPGPAESAGKKIDQATENVSDAVSNSANKASDVATKEGKKAGQVISGSEITIKVKSALLIEPGLESLKITVTTTEGIVTLSGSVNNQVNMEKVVNLTRSIDGVKSIKNDLVLSK